MANKSKYRTSNWAEYNDALVNRGSINLWVDDDILNHWYESNFSITCQQFPTNYKTL